MNIPLVVSQVGQYLAAGNLAAAKDMLVQAMQQAPGHPDLLHLAGHVQLAQGDVDGGISRIERAIARFPKAPTYHYNLGLALAMKQDYDRARKAFQQAIRLGLQGRDVLDNLAICQQQLGSLKEAKAVFQNVAKQYPNDAKSWLNLAKINLELADGDGAREALTKAEGLAGDVVEHWRDIASLNLSLALLVEADKAISRALELAPSNGELWYLRGRIHQGRGRFSRAVAAYDKSESMGYDLHRARLTKAQVLITTGHADEGLDLLDCLVSDDMRPDALLAVAELYSLVGDFQKEGDCLRRILEKDPDNIGARVAMVSAPGRKLDEQGVAFMVRHIDRNMIPRDDRCAMGFALGNHFRSVGQHDKAFRYFRKANRLKGYVWDRSAYSQWVRQTIQVYTPAFFEGRRDWGNDSSFPVLIVGMPRSGTTLLEQILSCHTKIFGAGELGSVTALASSDMYKAPPVDESAESVEHLDKEAVSELARNYTSCVERVACEGVDFVTNKLPHNFQQLGLFSLLFPRAPVIHVRRDPRDNLLSIYFQDFGSYHPYAYDLKNLAIQYWEQERLMRHWKSVLPNPIFTLNYEELVTDFSGTLQRLADFLGIVVEDAMGRFYERDRQVQTVSKWQVRQKLYTTSIARWKPYRKHLGPLFSALREFALAGVEDEYGLFGM